MSAIASVASTGCKSLSKELVVFIGSVRTENGLNVQTKPYNCVGEFLTLRCRFHRTYSKTDYVRGMETLEIAATNYLLGQPASAESIYAEQGD